MTELEHRWLVWKTYALAYQSRLENLWVRWWLERLEVQP